MRAVQTALSAVVRSPDCQWFAALYAGSALLTCAFGWAGYCIALAIAVALRHRIRAFSQRKRAVLQRVEDWYLNDNVCDPIKPVDADDAGGRA